METPRSYHTFLETFPKPGCAVCNMLLRDGDSFLDSLMYEYVNDLNTHAAFRASRGLCNEHSWQLTDYLGNALGIAILYRAAIDETLKIIGQTSDKITPQSRLGRLLGASPEHSASSLADRLEPSGPCVACEMLIKSEKLYIQVFNDYLSDIPLQDAYRNSDGLCLPHFRQALRQANNPERLDLLLSIQCEIWAKLKAEIGEFEQKINQQISEMTESEGNSWLRAIGRMAGEKGLFGLRR